MKGTTKTIIFVIICVILLLILESCQDDSNSVKINNKVHSINGEVLDIQEKTILSDTPFYLNTKEMRIYKFTYVLGGDEKTGWFRNKVFGEDWILDYQKD